MYFNLTVHIILTLTLIVTLNISHTIFANTKVAPPVMVSCKINVHKQKCANFGYILVNKRLRFSDVLIMLHISCLL